MQGTTRELRQWVADYVNEDEHVQAHALRGHYLTKKAIELILTAKRLAMGPDGLREFYDQSIANQQSLIRDAELANIMPERSQDDPEYWVEKATEPSRPDLGKMKSDLKRLELEREHWVEVYDLRIIEAERALKKLSCGKIDVCDMGEGRILLAGTVAMLRMCARDTNVKFFCNVYGMYMTEKVMVNHES